MHFQPSSRVNSLADCTKRRDWGTLDSWMVVEQKSEISIHIFNPCCFYASTFIAFLLLLHRSYYATAKKILVLHLPSSSSSTATKTFEFSFVLVLVYYTIDSRTSLSRHCWRAYAKWTRTGKKKIESENSRHAGRQNLHMNRGNFAVFLLLLFMRLMMTWEGSLTGEFLTGLKTF